MQEVLVICLFKSIAVDLGRKETNKHTKHFNCQRHFESQMNVRQWVHVLEYTTVHLIYFVSAGHELPYSIKMSHIREFAKRTEDNLNELEVQQILAEMNNNNRKYEFVLKHNKKSPKKHSIGMCPLTLCVQMDSSIWFSSPASLRCGP